MNDSVKVIESAFNLSTSQPVNTHAVLKTTDEYGSLIITGAWTHLGTSRALCSAAKLGSVAGSGGRRFGICRLWYDVWKHWWKILSSAQLLARVTIPMVIVQYQKKIQKSCTPRNNRDSWIVNRDRLVYHFLLSVPAYHSLIDCGFWRRGGWLGIRIKLTKHGTAKTRLVTSRTTKKGLVNCFEDTLLQSNKGRKVGREKGWENQVRIRCEEYILVPAIERRRK